MSRPTHRGHPTNWTDWHEIEQELMLTDPAWSTKTTQQKQRAFKLWRLQRGQILCDCGQVASVFDGNDPCCKRCKAINPDAYHRPPRVPGVFEYYALAGAGRTPVRSA
jgi:hypothetical protein